VASFVVGRDSGFLALATEDPMPVSYEFDEARATIHTRCTGAVTLAEVLGHFRELARDPDCPGRLDVLLDLGRLESLPSSNQLRSVSQEVADLRTRVAFGLGAIVAPTDALFGMMRMFEVFASAYFKDVHVFRSLDEAQAWLSIERTADHESD
jgi:hypothetical protein